MALKERITQHRTTCNWPGRTANRTREHGQRTRRFKALWRQNWIIYTQQKQNVKCMNMYIDYKNIISNTQKNFIKFYFYNYYRYTRWLKFKRFLARSCYTCISCCIFFLSPIRFIHSACCLQSKCHQYTYDKW
jgi:hypothetical protein